MAWRYLVPGLAVLAQLATAEDCKGTTTISTQAEATAFASCGGTYDGTIWIDSSTTDDISLDGVEKITGSLLLKNVKKMTSLSGDTLTEIGDIFGMSNILALTNLNFPALTMVDQILWEGLPTLSSLTFSAGIKKASVLNIQNTNLASLEGINLQKIDTLYLANNNFLEEVSMQLAYVGNTLAMAANGRNLKVDFPNMEFAYNMTFRNVSSLSMPSLKTVNSSLGFYSNFFQTIKTANLTTVGGSMSFVSNGMLTDIMMPELKSLGGGLQIDNNTKLEKVDNFDKLTTVNGGVEMLGSFTTVELPKITLVKGAFDLQSSKSLGNTCSSFQAKAGSNSDLRGTFTCKEKVANVPGTSSGSGSGSGGSSAGNSLVIPFATGIIGIVAAIFGML